MTDDWVGWVPIRLWPLQPTATVTWCYLGDARFVESFARQTIDVRRRAPDAQPVRATRVETLLHVSSLGEGAPLAGLIFHVSRCGSTLITQMLAAVRHNVVLSEPVVVDDIVRGAAIAGATVEQRVEWLRAAVGALGRSGSPEGQLFVKLDAWHVFDLPLFRLAFPGVPWVFLYRDPLEVLLSQERNPGLHMLAGTIDPARLGLSLQAAVGMPTATYRARVLGAIGQAALDNLDAAGRLVEYGELPGVINEVLAHFGSTPSESERSAMLASARFDAKHPDRIFEPAPERKRSAVTDEMREAAQSVAGVFEELEERRHLQAVLATSS